MDDGHRGMGGRMQARIKNFGRARRGVRKDDGREVLISDDANKLHLGSMLLTKAL